MMVKYYSFFSTARAPETKKFSISHFRIRINTFKLSSYEIFNKSVRFQLIISFAGGFVVTRLII